MGRTAVFIACIAAAWLSGLAGASCFAPEFTSDTVSVTIVRHRFHTGFAFATSDIPPGMLLELHHFDGIQAVEIGWGDREFYMASGEDYLLGARALLWPTEAVMHVVGIRRSIEREFAYSELLEIAMHRPAFEKMVRLIHDSFDRSGSDPASPLKGGLYGDSRFYPAHGDFHMFRTCNVWVSEILAAIGCPVSDSGNLHASDVVEEVLPFAIRHRPKPEVE